VSRSPTLSSHRQSSIRRPPRPCLRTARPREVRRRRRRFARHPEAGVQCREVLDDVAGAPAIRRLSGGGSGTNATSLPAPHLAVTEPCRRTTLRHADGDHQVPDPGRSGLLQHPCRPTCRTPRWARRTCQLSRTPSAERSRRRDRLPGRGVVPELWSTSVAVPPGFTSRSSGGGLCEPLRRVGVLVEVARHTGVTLRLCR